MIDRERKWQIEAINMAIARVKAKPPTKDRFEEIIALERRKFKLMNGEPTDTETQEKAPARYRNERSETD